MYCQGKKIAFFVAGGLCERGTVCGGGGTRRRRRDAETAAAAAAAAQANTKTRREGEGRRRVFPWDLRKKGREGGALGIDCCEAWAD